MYYCKYTCTSANAYLQTTLLESNLSRGIVLATNSIITPRVSFFLIRTYMNFVPNQSLDVTPTMLNVASYVHMNVDDFCILIREGR